MQLLWGINAALFPIVPKKIKQMVKMTQGILYGQGMHILKNCYSTALASSPVNHMKPCSFSPNAVIFILVQSSLSWLLSSTFQLYLILVRRDSYGKNKTFCDFWVHFLQDYLSEVL